MWPRIAATRAASIPATPPPITATFFLLNTGFEGIAHFSHSCRIHGAGWLLALLKPSDAPLVAGNTRTNTLSMSSKNLVGILRIGQSCTSHDHSVDFPVPDCSLCNIRVIHAPPGEDRDFDRLFRFGGKFNHKALGHIHRRTGVVEGVIGAGVHAQTVITVGFQQLGNPNAFFQRASGFFLPGERCLLKIFSHRFSGPAAYSQGYLLPQTCLMPSRISLAARNRFSRLPPYSSVR